MIEGITKPSISPIINPEFPIIKANKPTNMINWKIDNPHALIIKKSRSYLFKNHDIE